MFAKSTLPILLIIIALNAACCLAGECSGGNFPCAQLSKEECQNFEWSAWCTINDNKINDWDADCTGTVFCHQASTIHLPWYKYLLKYTRYTCYHNSYGIRTSVVSVVLFYHCFNLYSSPTNNVQWLLLRLTMVDARTLTKIMLPARLSLHWHL